MIENTHVTTEKAQTQSAFEDGFWDGYDNYTRPLLPFYFAKTIVMLTAREQGYHFGRLVRLVEKGNE